MTFLADESIDRQIVDRLRADGHQVVYVAEMDPGISDRKVLSISRGNEAILLTADKDYGDLVFRQGLDHRGIVLIRLAGKPPEEKAALVSATISKHGRELADSFAVLSERAFRIRRSK